MFVINFLSTIDINSPFGIFLKYIYIFIIGATGGYLIEVLFRRFVSMKRWINPGFLKGPCLPLYGTGLCFLHLICTLFFEYLTKDGTFPNYFLIGISNPVGVIPFWCVTLILIFTVIIVMTVIELIAGLIFINGLHIKLWDYSRLKGNYKGIICPLFSILWGIVGLLYWFVLFPFINVLLEFFNENLWIFTFFIGGYVFVFILDFIESLKLSLSLNKHAKENKILIDYEKFKVYLKDKKSKSNKQNAIKEAIERSLDPIKDKLKIEVNKIKSSMYIDPNQMDGRNESETPRTKNKNN